MTVVDFHCHFVGTTTPAVHAHGSSPAFQAAWTTLSRKMSEIDTLVQEQSAAGIGMSVLSAPPALITPAGERPDSRILRRVNEQLAEVVSAQPRVRGLATIDAYSGGAGAEEVEHAVQELGLSGIVIDCCSPDGLLLNSYEARPTLEAADRLGAAVFAHPVTDPTMLDGWVRDGLGDMGRTLARVTPTSVSILSLLADDLFDAYPTLRVVVPSYGAGALFTAGLVKGGLMALRGSDGTKPGGIYMDVVGLVPSMIDYQIRVLGSDRVVLGTDWPIARPSVGDIRAALAPADLTRTQLTDVLSTNAERLLRRIDRSPHGGP